MVKKTIKVKVPIEEVKVKEEIAEEITNVIQHLDRDPNDPRNAAKPNKLPSLNEG